MSNKIVKNTIDMNLNLNPNKDVYHAIPNDSKIYSVVNNSSVEDYGTTYKYVSREGHKLNSKNVKIEELVLDADDNI